MALAKLTIDLDARLAGLQEGMDKAVRIAERSTQQIEAKFSGLKLVAAGLGGALGAAFSVQGIAQLFRATVDGIDALNDLSDATGASIENLSGLENVALRSGNSIQSASDAVVKLNKALSDAKPGSEIEGVFKALGLSVKELKAQDPAQALLQVAQALSGYADDANKARAVQELFGKSLREVAPLLNDLAKAGQLNATVTTEQAKQAEKFNHELAKLSKNTTDAARAVAGPMVSALNEFIEKASKANDTTLSLGERFKALFAAFSSNLPGLDSVDPLKAAQDSLAAIDKALQRTDISAERRADLEKKRIGRQETINKLIAEEAAAQKASFRASQNYGDRSLNVPASSVGGKGKVAKPEAERSLAAAGIDEATLQALRAIESTDANKIRELDAALEALFTMRASGTGSGPGVDEAIQKLRDDLAKLSPAARKAAEDQKRLNELLSDTPAAKFDELVKDAELLADALRRASDPATIKQLNEALEETGKRMADIGAKAEKAADEVSEFAKEASRNIQDALGDTILQTLEGDYDNIEKLWLNMLKRMAAQAIAANLSEKILGKGYGSSTNEMGGLLGALLQGLKGGSPYAAGSGQMIGFPLAKGMDYVPYDNFPAILHKGERVVTAAENRSSGGPPIVNNFYGDVGSATLRAINLSQKQAAAQAAYRARHG